MRKNVLKIVSALVEILLLLIVLCVGYLFYRIYQNSLVLSPTDCTDARTVFQYLLYGK